MRTREGESGREGPGGAGSGPVPEAGRKAPPTLGRTLFRIVFVLVFGISGAVCISAYFIFRQTIISEIGRARVDILKQVGERTRLVKNSLATISNLYYHDPDLVRATGQPPATTQERRKLLSALDEKADRYRIALNELGLDFYMVVVTVGGFSYASRGNEAYDFRSAINTLWFKDVLARQGEIFWVSGYEDFRNTERPVYVFSAARSLTDPQTGGYGGILLINVSERILQESYRTMLTERNIIYIADERGSIVSHPDESMLGLNYVGMSRLTSIFGRENHSIVRKSGQSILFSQARDPESQWSIFEEIPLDDIIGPLKRVSLALAAIFVLCMTLSLALASLLSRRITRPLRLLVDSIERVRDGDLDANSDIRGWREIADISGTFNQMTARLKALVGDIKQKEGEKRLVELEFLRSQIHPHFLYNTLFSIKCLVAMERAREAETMLAAFIDLIRMTFGRQEEFVSLAEELELVERYAEIQKARYPEAFHIEYAIPAACRGCLIPRLILQPVVENAIFHGMDPAKGRLSIRIEARREGEDLCITVCDDGAGMAPERLAQIRAGQVAAQGSRNAIALTNVRRRMLLHFGEGYGLSLDSALGAGTTVLLRFPFLD